MKEKVPDNWTVAYIRVAVVEGEFVRTDDASVVLIDRNRVESRPGCFYFVPRDCLISASEMVKSVKEHVASRKMG